MAFTFPAAPTVGQTFTAGNITYTWDGQSWKGTYLPSAFSNVVVSAMDTTYTWTIAGNNSVLASNTANVLRIITGTGLEMHTDSANAAIRVKLANNPTVLANTTKTNMNGNVTIDLSLGTTQYAQLNGNVTFVSFTNWGPSGQADFLTLFIKNDSNVSGPPKTITWGNPVVKWSSNVIGNVTANLSAVDCFSFVTFDGGNTIFATVAGNDFR